MEIAEGDTMSMRPTILGGIALLILFGLSPGPPVQAQEASMGCGDCHEQAAAFTTNPHARGKLHAGAVPNAVCESCHGPGQAHMDGGGDVTKIKVLSGREGSQACLKCHDLSTDRRSAHASMHANTATVNCLTCHSIHSSKPLAEHLLKEKPLALCTSCHPTQAAGFRNKPYAHRLGHGGLDCTSCHDPHARPGRESLKLTDAGEMPCLGCHAEKRGPFVFPHGARVVGDCTTCHEPHGSSNPHQLKRANVYQLCIECHSPISGTTLGSQPPAFHNLLLARYRNCTTCHVAIHGSNMSPQLIK